MPCLVDSFDKKVIEEICPCPILMLMLDIISCGGGGVGILMTHQSVGVEEMINRFGEVFLKALAIIRILLPFLCFFSTSRL